MVARAAGALHRAGDNGVPPLDPQMAGPFVDKHYIAVHPVWRHRVDQLNGELAHADTEAPAE